MSKTVLKNFRTKSDSLERLPKNTVKRITNSSFSKGQVTFNLVTASSRFPYVRDKVKWEYGKRQSDYEELGTRYKEGATRGKLRMVGARHYSFYKTSDSSRSNNILYSRAPPFCPTDSSSHLLHLPDHTYAAGCHV